MKRPKILDLRPTQFVLGMKEVNAKTEKMEQFSAKELQKYCDEHRIPVVIGPHQEYYIVDHHHFLRACWELKLDSYQIDVLEDRSGLPEREFWNVLVQKKWINLGDQFGLGPHSPSALPIDIRSMADDPFRSLAWALIDQGAVKKVKIPFFEFEWASFLRLNLNMQLHSKSDFKDAIREGKKLAKSHQASHLPGFSP